MSPRRVTHLAGGCTRGATWYSWRRGPGLTETAGVDCIRCRRTIASVGRVAELAVEFRVKRIAWDAVAADADPVAAINAMAILADRHSVEFADLVEDESIVRALGGGDR